MTSFLLVFLFVWAFTRVRLAAFAQKTIRSLDLENQGRALGVRASASELDTDAAEASEAIR